MVMVEVMVEHQVVVVIVVDMAEALIGVELSEVNIQVLIKIIILLMYKVVGGLDRVMEVI
jgi:hypothetical protein